MRPTRTETVRDPRFMPLPDSPIQRQGRTHAPLRELPLYTVFAVAATVLMIGLADESTVRGAETHPGALDRDLALELRTNGAASVNPSGSGAQLALAVPASSLREPGVADRANGRAGESAGDEGNDRDKSMSPPLHWDVDSDSVMGGHTGDADRSQSRPASERGGFVAGVREGAWESRWPDGTLRSTGAYQDGLRDGAWETFSAMGTLVEFAEYHEGELHGDWRIYSDDGDPIGEGAHDENMRSGRWTLYYSDGRVKESGLYVGGLREGQWEFFDDLGLPTLRTGEYRAGIKIN